MLFQLSGLFVQKLSLAKSLLTLLKKTILGNLERFISEHLAQFLIFPSQSVLEQNYHRKNKRNYENIYAKKFKNELQSIDWTTALATNNNDVSQSLKFLSITNSLLDKYAPLKQASEKCMKTQSKPWITKGILTSIRKKVKIHSKSLKTKDQTSKEALNQEYKIYKNFLTNITKMSNENYYKKYFKGNKHNPIKVWKGTKEIILIKKTNTLHLNCLEITEEYSTDSKKNG